MRRRSRTQSNIIDEDFRSVINDTISLSIYHTRSQTNYVIKKDLSLNYDVKVEASEAPIFNDVYYETDPYEASIINPIILEKEIFPLNNLIKKSFDVDLNLDRIKFAIGRTNLDYFSVDSKDLKKYEIDTTLAGLNIFYNKNKDRIQGILNSYFEQGNVIYLNCEKRDVSEIILKIKLKILASKQQQLFFMQQKNKYYGLQLYIVIESTKFRNSKVNQFLEDLNIDCQNLLSSRQDIIENWVEIECDLDQEKIKTYLKNKYEYLNFFDVNNIVRFTLQNKIPLNITEKMVFLLLLSKKENTNNDSYSIQLEKEEIIASAKIVEPDLGSIQNLTFDKDISINKIKTYEEKLKSLWNSYQK